MTMSKTSVQPIDLDAIERQLRDVAGTWLAKGSPPKNSPANSSAAKNSAAENSAAQNSAANSSPPQAWLPERSDVQLAALARMVGRDWSPPSGAGKARPEPVLEGQLRAGRGSAVDSGAYLRNARAEEAATAPFEAELVPDMPYATRARRLSARRGILSPGALALAVPLLIVTIGVGATVAMRTGALSRIGGNAPAVKADAVPIKAPGTAEQSGKPREIVLTRTEQPAIAVAKPEATPAPAIPQPPAASVAAPAPAAATPGPTASPQPAAAAAPAEAGLSLPAAPASTPTADAAPPDPPQAAQDPIFGKPHRVSIVSVKPDGTIGPSAKPNADASAAASAARLASTDPTAPVSAPAAAGTVKPAAKKHADKARVKPSTDARQTTRAPTPIIPPATAGKAQQQQAAAGPPPGNPVSGVASLFRKVLETAHIVKPADGTQ
ncbi:MAG: hypothetical protein ACHQAY_17250 [Hyphomicrobiales bacterium]